MCRRARELLEETGYAGDPPKLLSSVSPNPGLIAQRVSTIIIHNAKQICDPRPDQTEELSIELVPVSRLCSFIKQGKIEHGICLAGVLWWLARGEEP